ncbi:MAG: type II toxin-antitoxin system prevent-host-death family antitoxin [Planctomycetes bacterium]|nr:type II toxin-antitoxin system prevent-host-death family antitoxin [Planctomycetota bacterium]MBM4058192.1 type II toxin-antitoxin system prevent-host-death family antitoxin [Planctomycetota bacterium]
MYSGRMEINATAFKARCLRLLDEVSRVGGEIVILKRGRPVARLVPARDDRPWLALRGRGSFKGDPFASVVEESEIDVLR